MNNELQIFLNSIKNKSVNIHPEHFLAENLQAFQQMESLGFGTYVYDYQNHIHHYISPNIFTFLEFTSAELKERNVEALFSKMANEDLHRVIDILGCCIQYVFNQPSKISSTAISRHFYRIGKSVNSSKLILQTNRIFKVGEGFIDLGIIQWVGSGEQVFPPYLHLQIGNIQKCFFPKGTDLGTIELIGREEEVMFWSLQGLTIPEIALKLNLSVDGIRFHRRKILKKYKAENFEAVLQELQTKS
jgi:DNA-binding CsgD family transcriptional regulator